MEVFVAIFMVTFGALLALVGQGCWALWRKATRRALAESKPKRTPTPGCYLCFHSRGSCNYMKCDVRRDPYTDARRYCDVLRDFHGPECDHFEPKALHEDKATEAEAWEALL